MSSSSLVDALDVPAISAHSPTRTRDSGVRQRKPAVVLSPAKKLLKVTGGRPLANADELRAFHDSLTIESIGELTEGLTDQEWKVRVRAILGLELCGERYGLQAVAHVKSEVLSLTGAPQASLRTAAIRFHNAVKGVAPGPPAQEKSAFAFIEDAAPEADAEAGKFTFEAEPEAESKAEDDALAEPARESDGKADAEGEMQARPDCESHAEPEAAAAPAPEPEAEAHEEEDQE
jgi:hypothetical protein